jgi:hypothetical protein
VIVVISPEECVSGGEWPRCGESARALAIPEPDRPLPPDNPGPVVLRAFGPPEGECGLEECNGGDLAAFGERGPC